MTPHGPRLQRLDRLLANCGYCSRREAGFWVRDGRVLVNGVPASGPSQRVEPSHVRIDGEPVDHPDGLLVMLHKPAGHVCSHDPQEGLRVYDLLPPRWLRRNPPLTSIGRLDKDATGLLLLTDVGSLVHRWTSPRHEVAKVYEVELDRDPDPLLVRVFASGTLRLEGEQTTCRPAKLELCGPRQARLTLSEGRYHQVKRMFASQGCMVTRLHRVRFGDFELGDLPPGQWRSLPLPQIERRGFG